MARKRINKRFAIILAAVVAGVGAAGVGTWAVAFRSKDNIAYREQRYNDALATNNFRAAFLEYQRVVQLTKPPSAEKWVQLGDIARRAVAAGNTDMVRQDKLAWDNALLVDPNYLPAITRLIEMNWEFQRASPSPAGLKQLRELAEKAVTRDTKDKAKWEKLIPQSTVYGWSRGVETDEKLLETEMGRLHKVLAAEPGDAETAAILATAYTRRAEIATKELRTRDATEAIQNAVAVFDAAMKGSPDNAAVHFRAAALFQGLRSAYPAQRAAFEPRYAEAINTARTLAKDTDPIFVEANLAWARDRAARSQRPAADEVFKALAEKYPDNLYVRLNYAEFLAQDPATRGKAIDLLKTGVRAGSQGDLSALSVQRNIGLEFASRIALRNYQLDAAAATTDRAEKDRLLAEVESEARKLATELPEAAPPVVMQGRVEMMRGRPVEAIRLLATAKSMMDKNPARGGEYYGLLLMLSDVYASAGQQGPAKDLLRQLLDDPAVRTNFAVRLKMIQLLSREGDREGVRRQAEAARRLVESGEATGGQSKEAMLAALATIDAVGNSSPTDQVGLFNALPEGTRAQQITKANLGRQIGQFDESVRLLKPLFETNPKDIQIAVMLVQAQVAANRTADAKLTLAQAIEASPDSADLKVMKVILDKGTSDEVRDIIIKQLEAMTDPFARAMAFYDLYNREGNREKASEQLAIAAKLKPDDRAVLDQQFLRAVAEGKLAEAEAMLPKLAAVNGDQAGGQLYRFRLLQAQGKREDALAVARRLTQDLPQFGQSWVTLGQAYSAAGDYEQALQGFQQALQRQPTNRDALQGAVECNYRLGRPADALRIVDEQLARNSNDATFIELRLQHELSFGDTDKALSVREKQVADQVAALKQVLTGSTDEKRNTQVRERLVAVSDDLGRTYLRASQAKLQRGDPVAARAMATKGATELAKVVEARPDSIQALAALIEAALMSDDPLSFRPAIQKAADYPQLAQSPDPVLLLTQYFAQLNKAEEAEKAVREAARRGGAAAGPRLAAADLLTRLGKVDDAMTMIDGIENAATNRGVQTRRAQLLVDAGRTDQAEKAVRAMLVGNESDAELQNLLTLVYINGKRFDDALRNVAQTLARDPRNVTATYYRGLTQFRKNGDMAAAIQDFQTVRDSGGSTPQLRALIVESYKAMNDLSGAARELRDAVKAEPTNPGYRLELANVLARSNPPRTDEALKVTEEGLKMPEFATNPDLLLARARFLTVKGDKKGAVESAKAAVYYSRSNPVAVRLYLETMLNAGLNKQVLDDTDAIVKQEGSKPYWVYAARGTASKAMNNREAALNEYTASIDAASSINDDNATAEVIGLMATQLGIDETIKALAPKIDQGVRYRYITALLLQRQAKLPESLAVLEPMLTKIDGTTPAFQASVFRNTGMVLVSKGPQQNLDRAVEMYQRVVKILPDDVPTLNNLAYLMSERVSNPNYPLALSYTQQAVDILRKRGQLDAYVFDTHGWLLVLSGRVAEGINVLNEAASRQSFVEVHYHLGVAYMRFGQPVQGLEQLRRAEELLGKPGADDTYKVRVAEALKDAEAAVAKLSQPPAPARP